MGGTGTFGPRVYGHILQFSVRLYPGSPKQSLDMLR